MARLHDLLIHQAETRPDAPAISDPTGAAWTYRDLRTAAQAIADELEHAAVAPGDRVMLVVENCAAAVAAIFACALQGAWAVPVNARMSAAELAKITDHARPRAALYSAHVSSNAADHARAAGAGAIQGAFGRLEMATLAPSTPATPGDDQDSDVAVILYTTGTTGDPKGVMLTHGNLRFGGAASAHLRGMVPEDVIYGVLPITHVFGLASVMTAAVMTGAQVRMEPRFSAAKLFDALRDGVTLLSAVPQMHAMLMAYTRDQGHDVLGSKVLRYVSSGAAPLDPTWKRKAEHFYGVALQNGYGMTETTAGVCATFNALGDPDTSVGPPLPGVEIAIDADVPGGGDGTGEILTRGGHVMKGYFRNPDETARVLKDGWMRTGDLGRIDARGHLHIVGRAKELIIHGGFNVYPPEVEAALNDHPQVIQSAVVGRARDGDEEVLAFVQIAPGCDLSEAALRAFVAERLAGYKRPARIVMATTLPAAPTGKILKHKLIAHFADALV